MENEDQRDVDRQLDEAQAKLAEARRKPLVENHSNNTRIEMPPTGATEASAATTVTEAARGTEGTAPAGEEPEG